ncbi:MAG: SDR family NAD(P)-dependent oxidoreductase, partial [Acidobacteriota bacterium]
MARLADDSAETVRAAIVASTPTMAAERLHQLVEHLADTDVATAAGPEIAPGVFVGTTATDRPARVGFLFPGQASPAHLGKRAWRRRFPEVDQCLRRADLPTDGDGVETAIAQPAIATASLAGLAVLDRLGVEASAAVGHSLGEWVALHWAGAFDADALVALTRARGRAMSELGSSDGAMASLAIDVETAEALSAAVEGVDQPVLAGLNGPGQTVIAGRRTAVEQVVHAAREQGYEATLLAVSHAFHSPLVAAARPRLEAALGEQTVLSPTARVASTITGRWWTDTDDPEALLADQVTSPVRFAEALDHVAADVDVLVEVGPGQVLGRLSRRLTELPVVSIDANGDGLNDLLQAVGCLFAVGAAVDVGALFADRFVHPIDLDREPRFLVNPCELAPLDDGTPARVMAEPEPVEVASVATPTPAMPSATAVAAHGTSEDHAPGDGVTVLDTLLQIVARRIELPVSSIDPESRLLADLHLSSIAAGELVTEAYLANDLAPPAAPTEYANASLRELAEVLDQVSAGRSEAAPVEALPDGVDAWVRPFAVEWLDRPVRGRTASAKRWRVLGDTGVCRDLADAFAGALPTDPKGGAGWILALDGDPAAEIDQVLELTRATTISPPGPLVILGPADRIDGAAAFARTLHLEKPDRPVSVIGLPVETIGEAEAIDAWVPRLLPEAVDRGFREVRLDADGGRREPVIRALPNPDPSSVRSPSAPLEPGDVLLVTGGGKGIGAECALDLARRFSVRLAVFGRSGLDDVELAGNLERFTAHGVEHHYVPVDLGDAVGVREAIAEVTDRLGPVRGVVHSAGVNRPRLIDVLEREDVEATLRPKVDGLEHLLAAVEPS